MSEPYVLLTAGARPNFMKVAPLIRALKAQSVPYSLIHMAQHTDDQMSRVFFEQLGIPDPCCRVTMVGETPGERLGAGIHNLSIELGLMPRPSVVVTVGDVDATLATAITARKFGLRLAHVEAGLRSRDWEMPEEHNRKMVDHTSDFLFTTDAGADANLANEGIPQTKIFMVGNVMIDNLMYELAKLPTYRVRGEPYAVATLHRPSNVDNPEKLKQALYLLELAAEELEVVLPLHPRTRARLEQYAIKLPAKLQVVPPLPYHEFLHHLRDAAVVLTDSGGIQEETMVLNVPCITMRENTERGITKKGFNRIVGLNESAFVSALLVALRYKGTAELPKFWDGKASERVVAVLRNHLTNT